MYYEARNKVMKLIDDFTTVASKAKCKAKHEKCLEILPPMQMPERLLMALN